MEQNELYNSIMAAIEDVATGSRTEWKAKIMGETDDQFIPVVISITKYEEELQ